MKISEEQGQQKMPKSFLKTIVDHKKKEVAAAKIRTPEDALLKKIKSNSAGRSLAKALRDSSRINIMAEIKRASPSKGLLCEDLDAVATARVYEAAGAAAVSVLTDGPFFRGGADDLIEVKSAVGIPVLRKDFIISSYQIVESAAWGTDAILLIVRILTPDQLKRYLNLCRDLNLEALVEVHSPDDVKQAVKVDAEIIGINNRNLSTFETDINRAMGMAKMLEPNQIPVVASGIHGRADIAQNLAAGLNNFLIGESLVRAKDPGQRLRSYMNVISEI